MAKLRDRNNKTVKNWLSSVKERGSYKKYPFTKFPPIVTKYPFYSKKDQAWFNFYYSAYKAPCPEVIPVPEYIYIETILNNKLLISGIKEKIFIINFCLISQLQKLSLEK